MPDKDENVAGLIEALLDRRRVAFSPPPIQTVDEWADSTRIVGREESRIAGRFRTSNAEAARGPMQWVTEPGVKRISLKTSAQFMKTMFLLNVMGFFMHNDPCPILLYQPTIDDIEDFSTSKLLPMLRNTPDLAALFGGRAALAIKSSDNQKLMKRFPGGYYELLHAGSDNSFARRSVRVVLLDEVTNFPPLKKGHWYTRAKKRTESYEDSYLIIATSTPSHTGECPITELYDDGDQRRAYVACPHCGHEDYIRWENVRWEKTEDGRAKPETARIFCDECGAGWEEHERHKIMTTPGAVKWRTTRPFTCCGVSQHPEKTRAWRKWGHVERAFCTKCGAFGVSNEHATGHVWAAYSPFRPLSEVVKDFIGAKKDREKLRAFVNEVLAETFEKDDQITSFEASPDDMAERREVPWDKISSGAKIITVGVDNQSVDTIKGSAAQGRLECEVVAWGDGDESWSLGYHIISGNPSTAEPWEVLDDILLRSYETEDGRTLIAQAVGVDHGGHHSSAVEAFCGARVGRRVWAVKGASEHAGTRAPIWPRVASTGKRGAKIHLIGTQAAKDRIADMLAKRQPGPGYMHIPRDDRTPDYLDMLTSEKRVVFTQSGRPRTKWVPKKTGIRNEALDCRVYALAALEGLRKVAGRGLAQMMPAPTIVTPSAPTEPVELEADVRVDDRPPVAAQQSAPPPKPIRRPRPPGPSGPKSTSNFWGGGRR